MSSLKKLYPSPQQKQLLIQLIEADPQLRSGKFSSSFTKKDSERRWKDIQQRLNSLNGANKSWEGWRKTWQDRKSNAKKKFALAKRQANMTGGGPPPMPPTDEDVLILGTIPTTSLVGHSDSQESLVEFVDVNLEVVIEEENEVQNITPLVLPPVNTPPPPEDSNLPSTSQETRGTTQRKQKATRPKSQQRLDQSLQIAKEMNETLKEKNAMKKAFYEQFIKLMEKQCEALTNLTNAINAKSSTFI